MIVGSFGLFKVNFMLLDIFMQIKNTFFKLKNNRRNYKKTKIKLVKKRKTKKEKMGLKIIFILEFSFNESKIFNMTFSLLVWFFFCISFEVF